MRRVKPFPFLWGLTLGLLISGCEKRETKKEYLARVGDSYLTKEEMTAVEDSTLLSSDARIRDYAARWINNELLYQEARRRGIENSETVQRHATEARKQLTIQAFLQKELYQDTLHIPEDSIRTYFESHPEEFLMREDVVKVNLIAFTSREKANAIRAKIVSGTRWESAVQTVVNDTSSQSFLISRVDGKYYTQGTLYPPELWRVATNLAPREISFPVRTQEGFFLIQLLAIFRQGAHAQLDMVRDEIHQRLIIEQRRQRYAELLARLRSQHEVEVVVP